MVTKILGVLAVVVGIGASGVYVVSEVGCPFSSNSQSCVGVEPEPACCASLCGSASAGCDSLADCDADGNTTAKAAALGGCFVGAKTCPAAGCCGD